jgi:hypothetical protein
VDVAEAQLDITDDEVGTRSPPAAACRGLRQFQIVPAFDRLRLGVSARDNSRPEDVVAAATATLRRALRDVGADVYVTTEVVGEIDRVGTGAKERLVGAATSGQSQGAG